MNMKHYDENGEYLGNWTRLHKTQMIEKYNLDTDPNNDNTARIRCNDFDISHFPNICHVYKFITGFNNPTQLVSIDEIWKVIIAADFDDSIFDVPKLVEGNCLYDDFQEELSILNDKLSNRTLFDLFSALNTARGFNSEIYNLISNNDVDGLTDYFSISTSHILKDVDELKGAIANKDAVKVVNALVDIIISSMNTLDSMNIDGDQSIAEVMTANKKCKPIKVEGERFSKLERTDEYVEPDHLGNTGYLKYVFKI